MKNKTALEKHSVNSSHNFYYNNVNILDNSNKYKQHLFRTDVQ